MNNEQGLKLRDQHCQACPFKDWGTGREGGKLVDPDHMMRIVDYLAEGVNHICHTTSEHVCFGGRELQLKMFMAQGLIKEPTNECLFSTMRSRGIEPKYK